MIFYLFALIPSAVASINFDKVLILDVLCPNLLFKQQVKEVLTRILLIFVLIFRSRKLTVQ